MHPSFPYGGAHTCCWAWGFLCFLAVLRPPSGSGSTGSSGYSSSLEFPTFAMGSPPAGSRIVCPRSERRFRVPFWVRYTGQFMVGPHASVCGVSACPVPQGVLPGGLRGVSELRLSFAPSSVLHYPMLGFSVASTTLAEGLGLSWVPCPTFCRLGFCTSVGGSACALQPLAPSSRVVLTEAAGLGRFLVLSIVLPWP